MRNAVAFANNDIIMVAWSYGTRPDGCMGFALYRIDAKGKETVLPSHAVFKGESIQDGQTTAQFPVQKFYWKDPYARPVAEQTGSFTFRYKIVPLQGQPGSLTPMASLPILTTNEVELTSKCSPSISATFNRGLISTQHVSKALKGHPGTAELLKDINDENNQLRKDLSGQMVATLTGFLKRGAAGGHIYAALYELTDAQLVSSLVALGTKLNIVLADIVTKPAPHVSKEASLATAGIRAEIAPITKVPLKSANGAGGTEEENADAHRKISASASASQFFYRLPPSGHIVHNKFLIYVDSHNKPQAVLAGSTNWTATGLCAQTNNAFVIDDPQVAQRYMDYWNTLKADQQAHQKDPKVFQAPPMRTFDGKAKQYKLDSSGADDSTPSTLTSYFSPNTSKARSKSKTKTEVEPIDMKDLETRVNAAKHAVLFLAFIPGTPSITNFAAEAQRANKDLFVRGCVTAPDAAGTFYYALRGTSPPKQTRTPKGQPKPKKAPVQQDPRVIAADALTGADAPEGWLPELLKAGFAITHDKIVVIDPFADDCVVVTGSHNLGYQASYNNDENLVMIQGNKKLAMAYATHVLDVYDHFSWRWSVRRGAKPVDANLKSTPDEWLDWYFDANGNIKTAQLKFWMQATV
ncbi:MAG: phospholipase D-like domain-containing protein [Candidatus Sulfotelmatobacter sp.]